MDENLKSTDDLKFTFDELVEALPSMLGVDSESFIDSESFLKDCSVGNPRVFNLLLDFMLVRKAYLSGQRLF